jgi:1,2-diacylglycerol 3-alpha-glucosyltransferase
VRVLMPTDVYFPRVNGVSSSIRWFARELVRRGHEVTVVAPEYAGEAHLEDFELVRLPARTIFFDPEDRLIRGDALRSVLRSLAQRRWDVVHAHTPFQAHRLALRLRRALGVPVVESYHTFFEQYVAHYLPYAPAPWLRWTARRLSRRICAGIDHLIVPSREMSAVLDGYGIATERTVLPTGLDLREFAGGDGAAFRRLHGIPPHQPVVVTVSRIAREKNIDRILGAVALLRDEVPDLLLLVAGEGPDLPRLRARTSALGLDAHVRFFGNLDRRTTLLDFYRAGDVFAFASPTETQGLVLIEAMALGVPIVSTAVMGTATVLEGTRCARVAPDDDAGFAGVLAGVLRNSELRATLAAAGPTDARRSSAVLYASLAARQRAQPAAFAA